jgi:hypothetical protein
LAAALALRPALEGEQAAIDAALKRLASLLVAESRAAAAVTTLTAAQAEKTLQWARGADAALKLPNGPDLAEARALLATAEAQAAAARAAEPQLMAEQQATLSRRNALEESIRRRVLDVLAEDVGAIVAAIAEHERAIGVECAKLAGLRRPAQRLAGRDGVKAAISIDHAIGERRASEADVPGFADAYNRLADKLVGGDATATLET